MLVHKLLPLFALGLNLVLVGSALTADRKSPRNTTFAWMAVALSVWNLGVFGLRLAETPATAYVWEIVVHAGVIPMAVIFYRYVVVFLEKPTRRPALVVGWALCALFLAVTPTPLFMRGVTLSEWGYMPAAGPLYAAFFVYFQAYLVIGFVALLQAYFREGSSFRRNRILLVVFGVLLSLGAGAVDFLRFMLGWKWLYPVGIPGNAIFALALGLAIVRYRLLDVGVLVKRFVLYLLTAVAVAPIVVIGNVLIDHFLPGNDLRSNLLQSFVTLAGVVLAFPLLRRLESALDRLMFQRQHGVRDALLSLSKEMASVLDLHRLGETLTEGLVTHIPVSRASLQLYDARADRFVPFSHTVSPSIDAEPRDVALDSVFGLRLRLSRKTIVLEEAAFQAFGDAGVRAVVGALERDHVALLVPMFLEGELAAALVVGEKLSGEMFGVAEIELLEMLAGQTAIALKNARLYDDLRTQMEELRSTQQQLVQSAKLAAIGELAASVAHEINNPLMVILGNSGLLLKKTPEDSPAYGKLAKIIAETNRAAKITRDLLDFSRRREPKQESVPLGDVVARALDIVQSKLSRCGVQVQTKLDSAVPTLYGDRDQLTQVFINLIGNALDAMPDGGMLVIRSEGHLLDHSVAVKVVDTGVGIEPDKIGRIFEPFFTTKPEGQGTGLGLSVSYGIVAQHGGTIEAASEPGRGTTMTVRLPLRSEAARRAVTA